MNTRLERIGQVAEILTRHGLGFLAGATGLQKWHLGPTPVPDAISTNPQRLRHALEELGPVFIKLGQMLSTRPDVVPPEYQVELSRLQDGAPPVPAQVIHALIQQELGSSARELFASFDDAPLASASIGQAHAATRRDGTDVVVKVRRPGIVARINEDLEILENLANHASHHWAAAKDLNIGGIAGDFAQTLRAELDYLQEGRNAERFAENFADSPDIHIPRIFWETTTTRVLTIERIYGIKVDDVAALDAAGIDRHALATRASNEAAKMIFEDGFFHADPHPGNLFVEPSGVIGLIDFGMVGEVSPVLRGQLARLLQAFMSNNAGKISHALVDLSVSPPPTDRAALRQDTADFMALYRGKALGQLQITPLISQLLNIVRHHHLLLPREMAMILKMLLMTEGMGARLDPEFSLAEVLKPYAARLTMERFTPRELAKMLSRLGLSVADVGMTLPETSDTLRQHLDDGFQVHLRAAELEPLMARAESIGNRLVAGMVISAFIRGLGGVATADGDKLRKWSTPLAAGGVGAVSALAAYLAWTGRPRPFRGR